MKFTLKWMIWKKNMHFIHNFTSKTQFFSLHLTFTTPLSFIITINVANMNIFNQNISSFGENECIALVFDSMVDGNGTAAGARRLLSLDILKRKQKRYGKNADEKSTRKWFAWFNFWHYDKNDESFIVSMYFAFQIYHFASELFKVIVFSLSLYLFLLLLVKSIRFPWIE